MNQWDLLEAIDGWPGHAPDPGRDAVQMPLDPVVDAAVADRLRAARVAGESELIVVHVSAGNPFRRWPEAAFVALVTALASANERRRIVLSSGPSDRQAADRIARAAKAALGASRADRIVDFGEFDLRELKALVERSALFVGGDTGPLHIAATTRTPIVGVYGPTLPERSAPWRDPRLVTESVQVAGLPCRPCEQRVCELGDFRCLTSHFPLPCSSLAQAVLCGI